MAASGATAACPASATTTPGGGGGDAAPPGDIPDSQAYVVFTAQSGRYQIEFAEGWARKDSATGVTFTDKFNSERVELVPAKDSPTTASAQAELATLRRSIPCFANASVSQVTRKSGTAILIKYRAASEPNSVTGKIVLDDVERYEFWQNGTTAVITLSAPIGSDNVDPWKRLTDSFRWH
jgi:hypothetical protein